MDLTCSICLDTVTTPVSRTGSHVSRFLAARMRLRRHQVALLMQCGHFFHELCLAAWVRACSSSAASQQRSCPVCRTEVPCDVQVEVITVDTLLRNLHIIERLRRRHARLHRQQQRQQQREQSLSEEELEALVNEYVQVDLNPVDGDEGEPPDTSQHGSPSPAPADPDRPNSPFTIITPEEVRRSSTDEARPEGPGGGTELELPLPLYSSELLLYGLPHL